GLAPRARKARRTARAEVSRCPTPRPMTASGLMSKSRYPTTYPALATGRALTTPATRPAARSFRAFAAMSRKRAVTASSPAADRSCAAGGTCVPERRCTMQDLSNILPVDPVSALAPTSQAGGNMLSSNEEAMTAPGSQPVDVLTDRDVQSDPKITPSNKAEIAPGTDGKPKATQ